MTLEENKAVMQLTGLMMAKGVPDHLIGGLCRYYLFGINPGGFLEAVLCNNLKESFARGDENSVAGLQQLVRFLYNHLPVCCWGNPENYNNWPDIAKNQGAVKLVSWTKAC